MWRPFPWWSSVQRGSQSRGSRWSWDPSYLWIQGGLEWISSLSLRPSVQQSTNQSTHSTWRLHDIDGLAQDRHNSIANTLDLCLSCTNPSICSANSYFTLHIYSTLELIKWKLITHASSIFSGPDHLFLELERSLRACLLKVNTSDALLKPCPKGKKNSLGMIQVQALWIHIEADTKWPPFSRRHFQMHFLEWKCMNFD